MEKIFWRLGLEIVVAIRQLPDRKPLILQGFSGIFNLIFLLVLPSVLPVFRGADVEINTEAYRSGHNGTDSKLIGILPSKGSS